MGQATNLRDRTPQGEHRSAFDDGALGISPRTARTLIGEVLYAVRLPDGLIKIGHTVNLGNRLYRYGKSSQLLAIRGGTRADETELHRSLAAHRHHGREWYHPTTEVLALINHWRDALGLPAAA